MSYPIDFMGRTIIVTRDVELDFTGGEGPIAAKYLNLKEGDTFFDVGAAWAMWTLYGLSQGAFVYSFEPSPIHYDRLVEFVRANEGYMDRCRVLRVALDKEEGTKTLNHWYDAHGSGGERTEDCFVPTLFRTIDSFMPDLMSLDCIKIDVEGGEYDVLLGGLRAIKEFRPRLIIENHLHVANIGDWMVNNSILQKMYTLILELGYKIFEEPHQGRSFIIADMAL